jgi:hypothetical protein
VRYGALAVESRARSRGAGQKRDRKKKFGGGRGRVINTKGARKAALPNTPLPPPHTPRRPRHAVEIQAAVRTKAADSVNDSPRPCLGCAVEPVLRVAPLRRGVPPQ